MVVGPVLVTVEAPRTANLCAVARKASADGLSQFVMTGGLMVNVELPLLPLDPPLPLKTALIVKGPGGVPAGTVNGVWATPLMTGTLLTVPSTVPVNVLTTVKLTVPPLRIPPMRPTSAVSVTIWLVLALKVRTERTLTVLEVRAG